MTSEPLLRLAMMAIPALCVVWGMLRGIGRLVMFTASVAVGAAAGWAFFRYGPGPLITWLNGFHAQAVLWGAVSLGLAASWFTRRFLASLYHGPPRRPNGAGPRTRAGLFSLLPSLLLVWGTAMGLRWGGGVERMRQVEKAITSRQPDLLAHPPLPVRLREGISTGLAGSVLDRVDPFYSNETSALGAIITLRRDEKAWQHLMRQPVMEPLVRLEILRPLIRDHDVSHALSFSHYSKLLSLPEMTAAATAPEVRAVLRRLPVEDCLRTALAGTAPPPVIPRAQVVE